MSEAYSKQQVGELSRKAAAIFMEALNLTKPNSNASELGAIFTICLAMSLERNGDEEDVREALRIVVRNSLVIWREYQDLRIKFKMDD